MPSIRNHFDTDISLSGTQSQNPGVQSFTDEEGECGWGSGRLASKGLTENLLKQIDL